MRILYPKPLLVLVHPGSLCGSFQTANDWYKGWGRYARTRRMQLCAEFTFLDAYKTVVSGSDLDDEIPRFAEVQKAVSCANRTYRAGETEEGLRRAAESIWRDFSDRANSIIVTGAWADCKDGCAWTVCQVLRRLSRNRLKVGLSPLAARYDIQGAEIEAGAVHPLGNRVSRVRWHVTRDREAHDLNENHLRHHSARTPEWKILGQRLKAIGGTVVCATFEEDVQLILDRGKTWVPLQKEIVLIRGEAIRCHDNSILLQEAYPHLYLCTGYALSNDGIWRSHSWCFEQQTYSILETTMRRAAYHGAVLIRGSGRRSRVLVKSAPRLKKKKFMQLRDGLAYRARRARYRSLSRSSSSFCSPSSVREEIGFGRLSSELAKAWI